MIVSPKLQDLNNELSAVLNKYHAHGIIRYVYRSSNRGASTRI